MSHSFQVSVHAGRKRFHLGCDFGQRRGITFGQLADAAGERLRDAVQFDLHGGAYRGQPFVIHDELLDFVLGQLRVFGRDLFRQLFLRVREFVRLGRLLLNQREVLLKHFGFGSVGWV